MKVKYLVALTLGFIIFSCSRDNDTFEEIVKQEEVALNDFTLESTEITIKAGEIGRIKITSGNGDYDYTQNLDIALINISADNQYVEARGLVAGGSTLTTITDVKSGKRIQIRINVE